MLPTKRLQKKLRRKLLSKKRQLLPSPPKKPLPRRHPRRAVRSRCSTRKLPTRTLWKQAPPLLPKTRAENSTPPRSPKPATLATGKNRAALKPDILAHIDLIKKLNANGEFFDEESPRYKAAALKALQAAKANDCLLEVSTGGVYRGYRKDFYPGPWLLGEWQKMGGKVIITSDSHDIASLTYGFDEAAAAIKAAGFTSVQVLTGNGFETQEL